MVLLPLSGLDVILRRPDGADDIALIEGDQGTLPTALRILDRLASRSDGAAANWSVLAVCDFELLLLHLRAFLLGPMVGSSVSCMRCGQAAEISFRITDYIGAIRQNVPFGMEEQSERGTFNFEGIGVHVPRVDDLLAVRSSANPAKALQARCVPSGITRSLRRRIERALARAAPGVSGPVGGQCPECGSVLQALFDVATYVVTELRRLATGVYAEVHLLAVNYGWDEAAILALPGMRRRLYAEMVRSDLRARTQSA
jgi:hypothetical protein